MGLLEKLFKRETQAGRPQTTTQETFATDVLDSPLPVVVDCWNGRCAPCQVMSGLLEELASQYLERIAFFKLNTDHFPEIGARYKVQCTPTLLFFHQGATVGRAEGLQPLDNLCKYFDHLLELAEKSDPPERENSQAS